MLSTKHYINLGATRVQVKMCTQCMRTLAKYQREAVRQMLNRGMMELTGAPTPEEAWRFFFEPGDVVVGTVGGRVIGRGGKTAKALQLAPSQHPEEVFRRLCSAPNPATYWEDRIAEEYPKGVPVNQWGELNHSRRWSSFFLWKDGTLGRRLAQTALKLRGV